MFGERDERLKFVYESCNRKLIDEELKIKARIRECALHTPAKGDIERYSDRYLESKLSSIESVRSVLDLELMPPELVRMFGEDKALNMEDMKEIESDGSSRDGSGSEETDGTEEIDNDYVLTFAEDEEDDVTNERNENTFLY
jgi:hypothetical protein